MGSNQRRGYWGKVHANESSIRATRSLVDSTSYQFLAGARIAQDQNCGIGRGDLGNLVEHFTKRFRGPNNLLKHRFPINLLASTQIFTSSSLSHPHPLLN